MKIWSWVLYLKIKEEIDHDGDNLSFLISKQVLIFQLGQPENAHLVYGKAPEVDKAATIHIILKVSDKGTPSLSRYKRIILKVVPLEAV